MINKGILSVLCAFTAAANAISIGSALSNQNNERNETDLYNGYYCENESTPVNTADPVYILHEYEGVVGIFDTSNTLIDVIDISVISLPMSERQRLASGFRICGDEELNRLIEAYSG